MVLNNGKNDKFYDYKTDIFEFSSKKVDSGKGYELIATAKDSSNLVGCVLKITNTNSRTATTSCDGRTTW